MKVLYLGFAVILTIFAVMQINDPDPVYWVAIYGGAALISFGMIRGLFSEFWTAIILGGLAAGLINAAPGFFEYIKAGDFSAITGNMQPGSFIESSREFLGLLFTFALLASFVISQKPGRSI